jgi:hypothetical protein
MKQLPCLLLTLVVGGCASTYRPPTAQQPHAIVKFRRSYAGAAGTSLSEHLTVNGHDAYDSTVPAASAAVPRTHALLLHPGATTLVATGAFFHSENRVVTENYSVQVPYSATESYSCGTSKSFRTCTRSVTHYRSETRTRTVMRTVRVTDAECARQRTLMAKVHDVYLIELLFQGSGVCRLSCFQQVPAPDGSFTTAPCPLPPVKEQ